MYPLGLIHQIMPNSDISPGLYFSLTCQINYLRHVKPIIWGRAGNFFFTSVCATQNKMLTDIYKKYFNSLSVVRKLSTEENIKRWVTWQKSTLQFLISLWIMFIDLKYFYTRKCKVLCKTAVTFHRGKR